MSETPIPPAPNPEPPPAVAVVAPAPVDGVCALRKLVRHEWIGPTLLTLALIALPIGLFLPLLEVEKLYFWESRYSVLTGIFGLWESGDMLLALVLLCFSVLFPIFKLGTLLVLWWRPMTSEVRATWLSRLEWLGRWSMLDVFAVAILVVAAKLGIMAECRPQSGVYVFGAAVLLSMCANARLVALARALTKY
jgi:paraquat-inducible protein A